MIPSMKYKEAMLKKVLPLILAGLPGAQGVAQVPSGDAAVGRQLVEAQCSTCHTRGDEPRKRQQGPSLAAIASMPSTTSMSLHAFLMTPHAKMPNYRFTSQEIDDIVAYILILRQRQ